MSDTYRRYHAIKQSLMQFYRPHPTGHRERHLNTLVGMICGLTGGQRAQLSTMADHAPHGGADQESVIARFRRWLKQDAHTLDGWFLPVATALLAQLGSQPLVLAIDGSVVGRGCVALLLSVVYQGCALMRRPPGSANIIVDICSTYYQARKDTLHGARALNRQASCVALWNTI